MKCHFFNKILDVDISEISHILDLKKYICLVEKYGIKNVKVFLGDKELLDIDLIPRNEELKIIIVPIKCSVHV